MLVSPVPTGISQGTGCRSYLYLLSPQNLRLRLVPIGFVFNPLVCKASGSIQFPVFVSALGTGNNERL